MTSDDGFFTATISDAALYTPDLVPLLGSGFWIEVHLDADPPTVRVEVSLDVGSAELLAEEGVFDGFEVPPYDDDAVPDFRLELVANPGDAAANSDLLRAAEDPAGAVLRAVRADDPYPPLALVGAYDLLAWAIDVPD